MRRTRLRELRVIGYYVGLVVVCLAGLMLIPVVTSLVRAEWAVAVDFFAATGLAATIGFGLMLISPAGPKDLTWTQGMVASAAAWLVGMLVAAIPYHISGYWLSYLDTAFDAMSGFTTTGLTLIQDLDHAPDGINMWRHMLTWVGGQGMVVLALTFFVRGLPGAFKLYVGEAKDERLMPNVVQTARAIWYVSVVYLVVGTAFHWIAGMVAGQSPVRAFLHGLWVFMAAWSTGGFAPMNQNVLYYHSLPYEIVTIVFFVIGSFNFNLHWAVWTGNRKELYRNLEIVTFVATSTLLVAMASWELAAMDVYPTVSSLFRRGYYSLISAHTTTGFMTTYARQFALEWGHVALVAITTAMLFGGSATSTAGGFKAVRIGLTVKALAQDVKKLLLPESALAVQKFHMTRETLLDDRLARTALSIIALYMAMWGCLVAIPAFFAAQFGWDIPSLMFEAASVSGNVGLSIGVTSASMPWVVKVAYIAGMWLGRLEFLSVFVLVGYLLKGWRSK